jgi:hypothetical protein
VQRRACYLALGLTIDGERDLLGMWFQETEGAKFWMQVLSELKQRGVRDILICCVDGLKGFPEAIEAIFPKTTVQTCIVHLIRLNLKYVPRREREQVARDLKPMYTALDADGRSWRRSTSPATPAPCSHGARRRANPLTIRSSTCGIAMSPYRCANPFVRSPLVMLVDSRGRAGSGSLIQRLRNCATVTSWRAAPRCSRACSRALSPRSWS